MPLLERLARRLEISSDRAEDLLLRVLDERKDELARRGHVDFPGVGRFHQTEEGISFEPDDRLTELIDARHAGTGPIPLFTSEELPDENAEAQAPLESSEEAPPEEVDAPSEPVWETREEHPLGDLPDESYEETSYQVLDEEGEDAETDPRSGEEAAPAQPVAEDPRAADEASDADSGSETASRSRSRSESSGTDRSVRRRSGSRRASSSDRRREDSRRTLAIVAGLLIVTGSALILYFLWSPGDGPSSSVAGEGSVVDTAQTAQTAQADTTAAPQEGETAATFPLDAPLRSSGTVDPTLGGSTWIVGSFSDSSRAASVEQTFRADGYRTSVLSGGSGYRVAVGQFANESAAEATRGELPSDISDQAWTLEFDAQQ